MEIDKIKEILENKVIGISGISSEEFYKLLIKGDNDLNISYIDSNSFEFCTTTLKSEISLNIKKGKIKEESYSEVLNSYLDIFEINDEICNKRVVDLSFSERYIGYILLNLLLEADVYIFNNLYRFLDRNNCKRLLLALEKLKELGKIIIIFDNINILYGITEQVYLIKNKKIKISGKTKEVLTDVESLLKNRFEVPDLPLITYLAKKEKGVRLFYHSDVRDIIKDVYKHV